MIFCHTCRRFRTCLERRGQCIRNEVVVKEITVKTEGTEVHITSKDVTIQAEEIVLEGGE